MKLLVSGGQRPVALLNVYSRRPAAENKTVPNINEAKTETPLRTTARFPVEAVQPVLSTAFSQT